MFALSHLPCLLASGALHIKSKFDYLFIILTFLMYLENGASGCTSMSTNNTNGARALFMYYTTNYAHLEPERIDDDNNNSYHARDREGRGDRRR